MQANIKVILFDADGVIQKSARAFIPSLESIVAASNKQTTLFTKLYAAVGANASTAQQFINDIIAAEQPCMVSSKDFPSAIAQVLSNWEIDVPLTEVLTIWDNITPYPEVLELIKTLQVKGYSCGLATNQQSYRASVMQKELGYDDLFDNNFYSCEMGVKKPNSEYFEYIISKLEIPASQLLFIDDKDANVETAKQVGLEAFVFNATKADQPSLQLTEQLNQYNILI